MKRAFLLSNVKGLKTLASFILICLTFNSNAQKLSGLSILASNGITVGSATFTDSTRYDFQSVIPLLSFELNGNLLSTLEVKDAAGLNGYISGTAGNIEIKASPLIQVSGSLKTEVLFTNRGNDTVVLSNVVPFGTKNNSVYITGSGPWNLARAFLFRPGYPPLRVILPDNAWELGYSSIPAGNISLCALARRQQTEGGQKKRYETLLPPGANVRYTIYADLYTGEWQNGLKLIFRDKYLFDLEKFDNTLYERPDLQWIKNSYIIVLQMVWDRDFYDRFTGKYNFATELVDWNRRFGHIDVFGIWPTWPRLGLDQRNQWDMYRNLPGSTWQLRAFARMARQYNTRLFISYNPWDNSTRKEDHLRGMAELIKETEADGVVLDTRGSSSYELQAAADSVRKGVIMFSEGMAVTRDMPGIISGRVHNAIFLSPELNLNKLIKPDFSIFRVCDVGEDRNHREIAVAFFNGYGTELNLFRPGGRGEGYSEDLDFLAKTTFILRQNNDAFLDNDWLPLLHVKAEKIHVNRWKTPGKEIYTVLNMKPEGFRGELIELPERPGKRIVSLWHHEEYEISPVGNLIRIPVKADGWPREYKDTRLEGSVDCIAMFDKVLQSSVRGDSLFISKPENTKVVIWIGNPSYSNQKRFDVMFRTDTVLDIFRLAGNFEGKVVLQCLNGELLKDENVLTVRAGKPWPVSKIKRTKEASSIPSDMVLVPGAKITYTLTTSEDFIPYPSVDVPVTVDVDSFLIDRYPVTNLQYYEFLLASGYIPADTTNFLKHWEGGIYKAGQEKYPVVYLSLEDMKAYADWAGKRLPSEAEWQLAAQGTDGRKWPWGNEFRGTWCNNSFSRPTPVDAFSKGASPYGVIDLVGNIWQMTSDIYSNGNYYFSIIRGGSYYNPDSSWWYIKGGPQPLNNTQIMLLVSPGFDRSATVGFRCVKDIAPASFRQGR